MARKPKFTISITDSMKLQTNRKVLPNGYLLLPHCCIARSGILEYSDVQVEDGSVIADGALISVYRSPEALQNCVGLFANLPLTLTHPAGNAITPENSAEFVKGSLGSNPEYEEKDGVAYIWNDIIVYDKDAQAAIASGDYEELSAGYETAFRQKRGTSPDGTPFEAEQFYLLPNHVALVEDGRCGKGCRVCDQAEKRKTFKLKDSIVSQWVKDGNPINKENNAVAKFKKTKAADSGKKSKERFFIVADEKTGAVTEISKDAFEALAKDEENEVLEAKPEDIEEIETEGDAEAFGGEETPEEEKLEQEELEADDEGEDVPGIESKKEDDEEELGLIEVTLPSGKTGKMDKTAYEECKRFLEMPKRGDKSESNAAGLALLLGNAQNIIDNFDIARYAKGDSVDTNKIKLDIISRANPLMVVKSIRADEIDTLYKYSVKAARANMGAHKKDCEGLEALALEPVGDSLAKSLAQKAKEARDARLRGETK